MYELYFFISNIWIVTFLFKMGIKMLEFKFLQTTICKFISLTWNIRWWTEKVISAQGRKSRNIKHDLNHLNIFIFKNIKFYFIGYRYFLNVAISYILGQQKVDFKQKCQYTNVRNSNCFQSMIYFSLNTSQHRHRQIVVYLNV